MKNENEETTIKSTLLVVDDNTKNLKYIGNLLFERGFEVLPALSAKQAFGIAKVKKIDLILLDVQMPEIDGFEACKHFKKIEETSHIPIIFLTARNDFNDILTGFKLGAVDYITKPFNNEELLARINTHLDLKHSKEKLEILNQELLLSESNLIKSNNELRQSEEKLRQLNITKDKFFSIIAHDLKNPLSNFREISSILADNYSELVEEEKIEYLNHLKDSSSRIFTLLENLLEWSRSQRGVIQFNPVQVDLKVVTENVLGFLTLSAFKKNIQLSNEVQDNIYLFADVNMLITVIRNLVSNAIKFTPSGGKVSIYAIKNHSSVRINVVDTGIGISSANIDKLFKIEEGLTTTGTDNEKGTGLGLILCKEFVEKNGGSLNVESEIGKGTCFWFTVPLDEKSYD